MRTSRRVKQKMFYSTFAPGEPIYERDSEGNIIYDDMPDGTTQPRVIGEETARYVEPIEFWNSISGELTPDELQAFGTEAKGMAKITYPKDKYPFAIGDVIWKKSEIKYKSDETVDDMSADYRIIGLKETGRHFYTALLKAIV